MITMDEKFSTTTNRRRDKTILTNPFNQPRRTLLSSVSIDDSRTISAIRSTTRKSEMDDVGGIVMKRKGLLSTPPVSSMKRSINHHEHESLRCGPNGFKCRKRPALLSESPPSKMPMLSERRRNGPSIPFSRRGRARSPSTGSKSSQSESPIGSKSPPITKRRVLLPLSPTMKEEKSSPQISLIKSPALVKSTGSNSSPPPRSNHREKLSSNRRESSRKVPDRMESPKKSVDRGNESSKKSLDRSNESPKESINKRKDDPTKERSPIRVESPKKPLNKSPMKKPPISEEPLNKSPSDRDSPSKKSPPIESPKKQPSTTIIKRTTSLLDYLSNDDNGIGISKLEISYKKNSDKSTMTTKESARWSETTTTIGNDTDLDWLCDQRAAIDRRISELRGEANGDGKIQDPIIYVNGYYCRACRTLIRGDYEDRTVHCEEESHIRNSKSNSTDPEDVLRYFEEQYDAITFEDNDDDEDEVDDDDRAANVETNSLSAAADSWTNGRDNSKPPETSSTTAAANRWTKSDAASDSDSDDHDEEKDEEDDRGSTYERFDRTRISRN